MHLEDDLDFLRDVLKKSHIRSVLLSAQDPMDAIIPVASLAGLFPSSGMTISQVMGRIENTTKYRFTNGLMLRYIFMRVPLLREEDLLFIGPYLTAPLSAKDLLELGEELGLPPDAQKHLKDYYDTLPIVSEADRLDAIIDTFCERIWQTASFSIAEISRAHTLSVTAPIVPLTHSANFDEMLADMEKMEQRYAFENELIEAVMLGQQHKGTALRSAFDERLFERRLSDPLRNAKNYCIIMNTLLRKGAEQGGVHPFYIDRTSSRLATRIEMSTDTRSIPALMEEIFSAYCQLVRKHATKQYSPAVKKAILLIDADISAELSLTIIAERLGISAGYLSTIFKKETGETVTAHIRRRRINHAVHLLNTTGLQIQTIAMHCGILDVQYFSKLFKKQIGKTPNEYRKAVRR